MSDTYGRTSLTPYAFFDPDYSSLRMSQATFPWASTPSSVTLPAWGMWDGTALYELPMSAPATDAPDCSSLLRTPDASSPETRSEPRSQKRHPGESQVSLGEQIQALLPTPVVNDMGEGKTPEAWDDWTDRMRAEHGNGNGHGKSLSIELQRLLPTPRTSDANGAGSHGEGGDDLRTVVSLLPTPVAADSHGHGWSTTGETLVGVARSIGAPTELPSNATPPSSDDGHLTLWTGEDD